MIYMAAMDAPLRLPLPMADRPSPSYWTSRPPVPRRVAALLREGCATALTDLTA